MCHHWLYFTKFPGELWWTFTRVFVDTISTRASILTHVIGTVIYIGAAVLTNKSQQTFAGKVGEVIPAFSTIFARILLVRSCTAKSNLLFAVTTLKPGNAAAFVLANFVNAGSIVLTPVI